MSALTLLPLLLLPATVTASDQAEVQGEPANAVKYRQAGYSGMARHMKALGMATKGKVVLPKADLVAHARALQSTGPLMAGWYPKGTGPDAGLKTEALEKIWSDRAGFEEKIKAYTTATTELVAKAETGDLEAIKGAMQGVGKSCGGCHDGYRKDDD